MGILYIIDVWNIIMDLLDSKSQINLSNTSCFFRNNIHVKNFTLNSIHTKSRTNLPLIKTFKFSDCNYCFRSEERRVGKSV